MPEEMDLNWLRGAGLQPGENELPQEEDDEEEKGIVKELCNLFFIFNIFCCCHTHKDVFLTP